MHFTTDLEEMLKDDDIQLITICTPAHTHYELAKKVIEAGKSVIVEKPFVDTLEHAKELLALGKKKVLWWLLTKTDVLMGIIWQ